MKQPNTLIVTDDLEVKMVDFGMVDFYEGGPITMRMEDK